MTLANGNANTDARCGSSVDADSPVRQSREGTFHASVYICNPRYLVCDIPWQLQPNKDLTATWL